MPRLLETKDPIAGTKMSEWLSDREKREANASSIGFFRMQELAKARHHRQYQKKLLVLTLLWITPIILLLGWAIWHW